MLGNTFGRAFRITTSGEAFGTALVGIVDGVPAGVPLVEADIQHDLDRRKPGQSEIATPRVESDRVRILSGTLDGVTTGAPIGLIIDNEWATPERIASYVDEKAVIKPGHATYTYFAKHGPYRDWVADGRANGRETAMRVAAGAIAKKYLADRYGIKIYGYLSQLGPIEVEKIDLDEVHNNPFFCPDASKVEEMEAYMDALRKEGNSVGAKITTVA
ncbi:chorismate synthase, partial [Candidatus Bipolaricaulota bacterium]|nr:chorismate synthase [Candidatus Bipolaricaulota bacterium]